AGELKAAQTGEADSRRAVAPSHSVTRLGFLSGLSGLGISQIGPVLMLRTEVVTLVAKCGARRFAVAPILYGLMQLEQCPPDAGGAVREAEQVGLAGHGDGGPGRIFAAAVRGFQQVFAVPNGEMEKQFARITAIETQECRDGAGAAGNNVE